MTEKGYRFLEGTIDRYGHLYGEVVVGTDANVANDFSKEIISLCRARGIICTAREDLSSIRTEYALAISWRWLIKHSQDRLIVFHDSLLPKYRGFNQLVSCLINRELIVGVTALFGADEFDTGDILFQSSLEVTYPITIAEAISKIVKNYVEAGVFVLDRLDSKATLRGTRQDPSQATYSLWRDDEDYRIDWRASADFVSRFIDAVGNPYKCASCLVDGVKARVIRATPLADVRIENRTPGKVLFVERGRPVVVCGTGLLKIMTIVDDETGRSLLPLPKYRIRFT